MNITVSSDLSVILVYVEELKRRNKKKLDIPELQNILLLSKGGEDYNWVCMNLMKCVVGCTKWSRRYYKENISSLATVSDESFLILTIENNYNRWVDESELDDEDDDAKNKIAEALYTNSGNSRGNGKGSSRRFHGWSRDGYHRFNTLHGLVKQDRMICSGFENLLRSRLENEYIDSNKQEMEEEEDLEEIFPANDMEGVKQPSVRENAEEGEEEEDSDDSDE
jgi:hypothetical protein